MIDATKLPRRIIIGLTQSDVDRLGALLGEIPYKYAANIIAVLNGAGNATLLSESKPEEDQAEKGSA